MAPTDRTGQAAPDTTTATDLPPAPAGVLRIVAPVVRLDGAAATWLGDAAEVVVLADTVQVREVVRLPGRMLLIQARVLDAEDAVLDVSGAAPPADAGPAAAGGTAQQPAGQAGAAGARGARGGNCILHVQQLLGRLTVHADGGVGGRGQAGGAGAQPQVPAQAAAGAFTRHWPQGAPTGPYGAKALAHREHSSYSRAADSATTTIEGCQAAYGETGHDGAPGGPGGRGGRGGPGGPAGSVLLRWVQRPAIAPVLTVQGGAGGAPGPSGAGGAPGLAGTGGRQRVFWYSQTDNGSPRTGEQYADEADARSALARNGVALAACADPGQDSKRRGDSPPPDSTPPDSGHHGAVTEDPISAADLGRHSHPGYLDAVRGWALQDLQRGMELTERGLQTDDGDSLQAGRSLLDSARLGWTWLAAITRTASGDLHAEAHAQLEALQRFEQAQPLRPA